MPRLTMRALVLSEAKGLDAAGVLDQPVPAPGPGEVRVAIVSASLNHRELWISRGLYPGMRLPCSLGSDGAGVIDAVGEGVSESHIGREVVLYPGRDWGDSENWPSDDFRLLGMPLPGTVAEFVCVPVDLLHDKPRFMDFGSAAALPTAALTAWRALFGKARLKKENHVLITGIGGGVAAAALAFSIAAGARVWVTSSNPENIEKAVALGAQGGFDYRGEDWGKAARSASRGFDIVVDGAPAGSYQGYGRAIRMGARIVIYGSTAGQTFSVDAPGLFLRHATIFGTAMGSPADFAAMMAFIEAERLQPVIHGRWPMEAYADAFAALQGEHFGKIVVDVAAARR